MLTIKDGKKILTTPVSAEDLKDIHIGDVVYLNGDLTTCRDVAHRRLVEEGRPLPVDVKDAAIFHAGPIIRPLEDDKFEMVSVGPTTSMRMEKFEYEFVQKSGVRVIVGKGGMGPNTERACKEFGAIHCVFPAGNAVVAATEVEEISYDQIPMLDKDSAEKLGNRKLGELSDMVSQFEVAEEYTQINYKGRPVRVTPLRYGDWIKWFNNRSEGLPAYLIIDMVTQNVEVVRLEQGIRYTTAEHFGRNLYRYLQFHYPTYIFDKPAFEIDEDGDPYWVCPRIRKTIGLFGGTDINGAVLVNAVTGEHQYYDAKDVPDWVDHVYTADLIVQQYDYHGTYIHGFINSLFGQRDVTVTTDGYNYIAIGDDVYMYTGITSVVSDQSNIGFILSNQRTKETRFYSVAGAEEYSAMDSARGQVQQMNYTATFPLLLNIADQPSYFMALKDAAGLVKMYAMVNVSQYQIVALHAQQLQSLLPVVAVVHAVGQPPQGGGM